MSPQKKISQIYEKASEILWDDTSRIVLMSDCHRGNGSAADNFMTNQNIALVALNYYFNEGFTYIELGDGDELWENKNFDDISKTHQVIFQVLKKFFDDGRLFMIFGNHDIIKKDKKWSGKNLRVCCCEHSSCYGELFPNLPVYEALVLKHKKNGREIFLLHGHQIDFLNYDIWPVARFLVRNLWRPLEMIGVKDPTSASNNSSKKDVIEKAMSRWASDHRKILICGHTHRTAFPKPGDPPYFNDGCLVYSRYLTALEIWGGKISLVKWRIMPKQDGALYVGRQELEGPIAIEGYF